MAFGIALTVWRAFGSNSGWPFCSLRSDALSAERARSPGIERSITSPKDVARSGAGTNPHTLNQSIVAIVLVRREMALLLVSLMVVTEKLCPHPLEFLRLIDSNFSRKTHEI